MPRPASVTVFGVLNMLFGALGAIGTCFSAAVLLAPRNVFGPQDDALVLGQNHPVYQAWMYTGLALGLISSVVLFAAGIGLLNLRPWGRTLSLGYVAYAIVSTIVGVAMQWWFVLMPLMQKMQPGDGAQRAGMIGGAIGGVVGVCVGLIYPLLLWYFMTRRHVVAAFAGIELLPETFAPGPSPRSTSGGGIDLSNPYLSPAATDSGAAAASAPPAAVESIVETFIPSQNGPALTSYYLGLFSLFPCLGLPLAIAAVYYGLRGLKLVRDNPAVRGGAHAWVGLLCGILFGLFNLALLALVIMAGIGAAIRR